jgi:hypothetical protein
VLHQAHTDVAHEPLGQRRVAEIHHAHQHGRKRRQGKLGNNQPPEDVGKRSLAGTKRNDVINDVARDNQGAQRNKSGSHA